MGELTGVRVLDLSRLLPGPACSWHLAGLGASVDRVEPARGGDPSRSMPPFQGGVGLFFSALCAGQRSLAVDLRHQSAGELLHALLPSYDVLIEGFRPGVLEALGLGPTELQQRYPRLILARLSGFGQTGPWSQRPGHDINYAGLAGVLSGAAGTSDGPRPLPVQVADLAGALLAATGIAAALYARERSGRGRVLDISLTEGALAMLGPHVACLSAEERDPRPEGEILTGALPVYGTYRCADGRYLTVGALEPKFQQALRQEVGAVDRASLRQVFATEDRDTWVERLSSACVGPVLGPSELHRHPHHIARRALVRAGHATFVRPPLAPTDWSPGPVPALGEHTLPILDQSGVPPERVEAWSQAGVFG